VEAPKPCAHMKLLISSRTALAATLFALVACGDRTDGTGPTSARILEIEKVSEGSGVQLFKPVAVENRPDGLYVLDGGHSELYRFTQGRVDTIARSGKGPGELTRPSAMAWWGDSLLVVVDEGNARVQVLGPDRTVRRTVPLGGGAISAALDPARGHLYVADFGRNFALMGNQPILKTDSLVRVIDLHDGKVLREFGTPRPYEGTVIPILANYVSLARNPTTGEIWISWPLEPVSSLYSGDGMQRRQVTRTLGFTPAAPREEPNPSSPLPLPRADVQRVTFGTAIDRTGAFYVLTAQEPKTLPAWDSNYTEPRQSVQIFRAGRPTPACRVDLPVTGDFIALDGESTLFLADVSTEGEVYRIRYSCT